MKYLVIDGYVLLDGVTKLKGAIIDLQNDDRTRIWLEKLAIERVVEPRTRAKPAEEEE